MTIDKNFYNDYVAKCDGCGTTINLSEDIGTDDKQEAEKDLHTIGWRSFKAGRVTMHECETCATETETETQNDEEENDDDQFDGDDD